MKRNIETIIISILGILFLFSVKGYSKSSGYLISISDCEGSPWSDHEECVVCNYENKTLHVKHLNASYNCCFENLRLRIEIKNNHIVIQSKEKYGDRGPCD